jgi:hypothetical protein
MTCEDRAPYYFQIEKSLQRREKQMAGIVNKIPHFLREILD